MCSEKGVDIGFLEKSDSWKLESRFFPSKVGGRPSWLNLFDIPLLDDVQCENCSKPCLLLCQLYAPLEKVNDCFHRTIFVLICRDEECCKDNSNKNFIVFRCQLSRENSFYPFEPPVEQESWKADLITEKYINVCRVCGHRSANHCGKCKTANYCSKQHQIIDWKAGHKEECSKNINSPRRTSEIEKFLLPEHEIVIESEDYVEESEEKSEEETLREYEKLVAEGKAGTLQGDGAVDSDLRNMALKEDKPFRKFLKIISQNPEQVVRYERGGSPLWLSDAHVPHASEIPNCQYCNGPRQFEFQVLPQMLNYLALDSLGKSIDWGTLVVYTCKDSCSSGPVYKKEFLWKQDFKKGD